MRHGTLLIGLGTVWLLGSPGAAAAAHPFDVYVMDVDGNPITVGSPAKPYSPKQTCGNCHNYESHASTVTKQQTVGGVVNPAYDVKVATHGVTSGYHFQQGMNVAWGDVQRNFYKVPSFTSSPGMLGKF